MSRRYDSRVRMLAKPHIPVKLKLSELTQQPDNHLLARGTPIPGRVRP